MILDNFQYFYRASNNSCCNRLCWMFQIEKKWSFKFVEWEIWGPALIAPGALNSRRKSLVTKLVSNFNKVTLSRENLWTIPSLGVLMNSQKKGCAEIQYLSKKEARIQNQRIQIRIDEPSVRIVTRNNQDIEINRILEASNKNLTSFRKSTTENNFFDRINSTNWSSRIQIWSNQKSKNVRMEIELKCMQCVSVHVHFGLTKKDSNQLLMQAIFNRN